MKIKKLSGLLIAACLVMTAIPAYNVLADYEVTPQSITIIAKTKEVAVGKKIKLDAKLTPKNADDDLVRWSSSNSSVAKVMDTTDDDTDIKGIAPGKATITATVYGTNLKDTFEVTVKEKTNAKATASDSTLTAIKKQIDTLRSDVDKAAVPSSYSARKTAYRAFDKRLNAIENSLEEYEDDLEHDYKSGAISKASYKAKERALDLVEDKLDDIEDTLEYKFDIDD